MSSSDSIASAPPVTGVPPKLKAVRYRHPARPSTQRPTPPAAAHGADLKRLEFTCSAYAAGADRRTYDLVTNGRPVRSVRNPLSWSNSSPGSGGLAIVHGAPTAVSLEGSGPGPSRRPALPADPPGEVVDRSQGGLDPPQRCPKASWAHISAPNLTLQAPGKLSLRCEHSSPAVSAAKYDETLDECTSAYWRRWAILRRGIILVSDHGRPATPPRFR